MTSSREEPPAARSRPGRRASPSLARWAYAAAIAGLTLAATLYVRVPGPGAGQYFNLGEAVIYSAALLAGPWMGAAGAVGAALADLLVGAAVWAPWTLVVKAVEGALVGWMASRSRGARRWWRDLLAIVPGALWMMAGYALAAWVLLGPGAVPAELVIDGLQTSSSAAVALAVAPALRAALGRAGRDVSVRPG
ncbi:MAG: ECF transporter S component [Firmicutes bacterium]|uniref:ECF transporter S component n=1 Tax=Geochorda subterranea TaxID=3109564 RepID=A0ABZ1BRH2_9FIRM|nr:ECF transporter S component [Limnochorda sp. LNt]NLG70006.1 ECF transporter S component [Bacillota bacterium]WRP15334.1 ECF transporter S component [Limnochorda sp. LNt]